MIPVVTPKESGAIDAAAPEPIEVLIGRAGEAVARTALEMLGGAYGRRVVVLVGKGNNGNDGRHAGKRLSQHGAKVQVIEVGDAPARLPECDLVVDAAFGTGFHGDYTAPDPGDAPVLAVDIPSGVNGLTGEASTNVMQADQTVTFAALKPGLLLSPGSELVGEEVTVTDIGLDTSNVKAHLVEEEDFPEWLPPRSNTAHKWQSAVSVIGGSAGMEGAAVLTSTAALRAGAGYVRWSSIGNLPHDMKPVEVVGSELPETGWAASVLDDIDRFHTVTVGNGLGLQKSNVAEVKQLVAEATIPVVVDADAITLLGEEAGSVTKPTTILTPHDGEFARLAGGPPGADRIASARDLAMRLNAVVLLKGPSTIVSSPDGEVLVSVAGDARLATLGTGDVLTGVVGALCAQGADPWHAEAAGAFLHGTAGDLGWPRGLIASDIVSHLPLALETLLLEDV